jgi:hypothetical protein
MRENCSHRSPRRASTASLTAVGDVTGAKPAAGSRQVRLASARCVVTLDPRRAGRA